MRFESSMVVGNSRSEVDAVQLAGPRRDECLRMQLVCKPVLEWVDDHSLSLKKCNC